MALHLHLGLLALLSGCIPSEGVLGDEPAADDTAGADTALSDSGDVDTDTDTDTDPDTSSDLPPGVPANSALVIEIRWALASDDMDLHLLAPGGSLGTERDCDYENCREADHTVDWGEPGVAVDDPVMLDDDVHGTGPEVIYLEQPADGTYTVVVHDYPGSVLEAPNDVTTTVYLDGEVAWTDTRPIDHEDGYFDIAAITFPGGTVEALSGMHGAGR